MPGLLWRGVPPGVSGMANYLEYHAMGNPFQAWYTPTHTGNWRSWVVTQMSLSMCLISGQETVWPQYLPLPEAWKIANLLAERKRRGKEAMRVDTVASGAARICTAALERKLDISGTCFRVSGEPFSQSKEEIFNRAGCIAWCTWAMSEAGTLGGSCANRRHRDEVHIALNKVALTTGDAENGGARALYLTTIHPCTPKLMLNFDTGDHALTASGECVCELERAGLRTRIHSIRNGKKFTAGGMTFPAADLTRVVEDFLPVRFGGVVGDYQLVETEESGMPRVLLLVSPEVGDVNNAALEDAVIGELSRRDVGTAMMAEQWRTGGVLKVVRDQPWRTQTAKTPPFRMIRKNA